MEITVKELIRELSLSDPELPVYFCGLDFYRVKDRGGMVQIEFNQTVYKEDDGRVIVVNYDIEPPE
jgi:hypothetical protein